MMVAPARRRTGLGRTLLQAAAGWGGTREVWTSTNRSNAAMRALLAAEGWDYCGELVGLDEGDPELFFRTGDPRDK